MVYGSIRHMIEEAACMDAAAPAVLAPHRAPLTYSALLDRIDAVHHLLRRCGIGPRDRVALLVSNGPEAAVAFLTVATSAICVPINPEYHGEDLDSHLAAAAASLLIVDSRIGLPAPALCRRYGIPVMQLAPAPAAAAGCFTLDGEPVRDAVEDEWPRTEDTALVLLTSGTTARAKRVPLTHANLCVVAHQLSAAWALTARDCCADMMPLYHSGGVNMALTTLATGGAVACPTEFNAQAFFALLREARPTWYGAVPAVHRAILSGVEGHRDALRDRTLRFVCTGAAAAAQSLIDELERVFAAPVIQSYGLSEVGVISSSPLPPGLRKPGSVGVSIIPDIAIVDEHGVHLPPGATGEIAVRGPNVFSGYEDGAGGPGEGIVDGWFRTGDFAILDADGYLFLKGRSKDLINRGGVKIWPKEVEEVLQSNPAVADAVVFPVAHPTLGEDVAAAVVPHGAATVTERDLRELASQRLPVFKVPSRILVVDGIPRGPTGKIRRQDLADRFAPLLATSFVAPADHLERLLAGIWAATLRVDRVGIHDNFFARGGDSLRASLLLARVRATLGADVTFREFFAAPTIEGLAVAVLLRLAGDADTGTPAVAFAEIDEVDDEAAREVQEGSGQV